MLISAGIAPSKQIMIHGFITGAGGQKMSKSLGNVINPFEMVEKFGTDALRYFLLHEVTPFEDSPFTEERMKESYNAKLANGLGNLVSRVMKMSESYLPQAVDISKIEYTEDSWFTSFMDNYEFNKAMDLIWGKISDADLFIQTNKPFEVFKKDPETSQKMVRELVGHIYIISKMLSPFMPETSRKILKAIRENKMPEPLFLRKE